MITTHILGLSRPLCEQWTLPNIEKRRHQKVRIAVRVAGVSVLGQTRTWTVDYIVNTIYNKAQSSLVLRAFLGLFPEFRKTSLLTAQLHLRFPLAFIINGDFSVVLFIRGGEARTSQP